jgi:ABC-type transport system involved in cytochrome bd biosynthesis fused ATPase/permease subunit
MLPVLLASCPSYSPLSHVYNCTSFSIFYIVNYSLFDGTIRENILHGRPGATDAEVEAAARAANAHE